MELQEQRFLVTGASRGIGQAIAVDLAAHGAKVAGLATRLENLAATAQAVEAAGGVFLPLAGDIADPQTANAAVAAVIAEWGGVDGLVANAGITRDGLLIRMSAEDFASVLATNLGGAFHFLKAVTRPMMKARSGRVVLIGSVVACVGNPGQANYCAAKAGLHGLARFSVPYLRARRNHLPDSLAQGPIYRVRNEHRVSYCGSFRVHVRPGSGIFSRRMAWGQVSPASGAPFHCV